MGNISTKILARAYRQRPIVYLPIYRQITGSTTAGIMLSQLMYWHDKMQGKEFWKTDEEIMDETALTKNELRGAKKTIKKLPFVNIERKGVPCRTFYKIDEDGINECIIGMIDETCETSLVNSTKLVSLNSLNKISEKRPTNIQYITQDITTDTPLPPQGGHSPNGFNGKEPSSNPHDSPDLTKLDERLSKKKAESYREQVIEIVDHFNAVTGRSVAYSTRESLNLILAHLKDGFTPEDFKAVIDYKTKEFAGRPEMERYINLATYCRKEKFEGNVERANEKPGFQAHNIAALDDCELPVNIESRYQNHIAKYLENYGKIPLRPLSKSEFFKLMTRKATPSMEIHFVEREIPKYFNEYMSELAARPSLQNSYGTVYAYVTDQFRKHVRQKIAMR